MHSLSFAGIFCLITSALSAAIPQRGPITAPIANAYTQLIINDIGNIDKAVKSLTTQINAYQGGVVQASPLFAGVLDIHLVNRKAFVDAIPPVSATDDESMKIVVFTEDSVGQSIPASVDALVGKKPQLEQAGTTPFVVPGLKLLQDDHDSYSAELLKKVSPKLLPRAQAVVDKIHNAIQGGINAFSS